MALISCPECLKYVSSAAPQCPNCGYPISHSAEKIPANSPASDPIPAASATITPTASAPPAQTTHIVLHSAAKDFKGLAKAAWTLVFIVCGVALIPFLGFASWLVAGPVLLVTFIMSIMVLSRGGTLSGIFLLLTSIIVAPVFIAFAPFFSSLLGLARIGASKQQSDKPANNLPRETASRIASSPNIAPTSLPPRETMTETSGKSKLSEQSKVIVGGLTKPVQTFFLFPSEGEAEANCRQLLREYEIASNGKITVEEVKPLQNLTRARELQAKYGFGANENIVILEYDGKRKFIDMGDMAEFERLEPVVQNLGRSPRMTAFKGEQLLTNALVELTQEKQKKIYILGGHGEYDFDSEQNKFLKVLMVRQNITMEGLILANHAEIKPDVNALVILNPHSDYSEHDLGLLTDYWNRNGRLFILLGSVGKKPNFDHWLAMHGIEPRGDTVLRVVKIGELTGLSELEGIIAKGSPITQSLGGVKVTLIGQTQSLRIDRTKETKQLRLTVLADAPEGFWGETECTTDRRAVPVFDPVKDHAAPLTLAASVEKDAVFVAGGKAATARMVVFGNGEFLSTKGLSASLEGFDLAKNALNWLLNRDNPAR